MLHYIDSFDFLVAVDAWDEDIGTGCLMQLDVFTEYLGLAFIIGLTLDRLIVAHLVMRLNLLVTQSDIAPKRLVLTLKLYRI